MSMKKIYYLKNGTKLVAISEKKIRINSIKAVNYTEAYNKLTAEHINIPQKMKNRLGKIFTEYDSESEWIARLNSRLGHFFVRIVENRVRLLGVFAITGMVNYLTLDFLKSHILQLSFVLPNPKKTIDIFSYLSIFASFFSILFLLFLIPKKKYNVVLMILTLVFDGLYLWLDKETFIFHDKVNNLFNFNVGTGILKDNLFLTLLMLTTMALSFIVYNIISEIYKWLIGTNRSIEVPKLSLIWAIIVFILGLLFK